MSQSSEQTVLPELYVTLVTGTADGVSRLVVTDRAGREVGILGGVQSAQFHTDAGNLTTTLNISVVRHLGTLESA